MTVKEFIEQLKTFTESSELLFYGALKDEDGLTHLDLLRIDSITDFIARSPAGSDSVDIVFKNAVRKDS